MPEVQHRLTDLYEAFNRRDVDAVLAALAPDVVWPNGWEGGTVKGHDQVREYWIRQWAQIEPTVVPIGFFPEIDGRTAVNVHQVVRDHTGSLVADEKVTHIFSFARGLVTDMEIRRP
jgi:nuclear transport factor 2 (NTF2) superfamily protein